MAGHTTLSSCLHLVEKSNLDEIRRHPQLIDKHSTYYSVLLRKYYFCSPSIAQLATTQGLASQKVSRITRYLVRIMVSLA